MHQTSGKQQYVVAVTVQKLGENIVITYQGGMDTDKLLHSTVSINGIEQSKKLGNSPGDTITLEKVATKSSDHVVVIGYFNDGSSQTILDIDTNTPGSREIYYRPPPEGYLPPVNTVPPFTYRPQMRY